MNKNWVQTSLGELENNGEANIQTGPFGTVLKASEYSDRGSPVISVGEIRYGYLHVSDQTPTVSDETKERLPQFVLKTGDIVFGRKGAIDRNSIVNENQNGWFLGSDGIRLRLSENIDSLFVSYQFRCPTIGKWLLQNSSGSVMPSLNQKILNRLPLWLPNKNEQQIISTILSALDKKIELNNLINSELEAMAKLIYDYWFVQFDFPDAKGKPYKSSGGKMVYNEALKREIPDGWEARPISDLLDIKTGKKDANHATSNGMYHFFTCGNKALRCDDYKFNGKSVLLAGNGNFNVKKYDGKFNAYQRTYVLMPENQNFYGLVFYAVQDKVKQLTKGSRGSIVKFITKGDIEDIHIPMPKNDNDYFYGIFNTAFDKIDVIYRENQKLTELRDWLLPMLMNGQVTVKDAPQ